MNDTLSSIKIKDFLRIPRMMRKYKNNLKLVFLLSLILAGHTSATTPEEPNAPPKKSEPVQTTAPAENVKLSEESTSHSHWKGPYLGGAIGGTYGTYQVNTDTGSASTTSYFSSQDDISAVNQGGTATLKPQKFVVGIRAGDDWTVWNNLVLGAVLDYSSFQNESSIDNTGTYPSNSGSYTYHASLKTDWLFMLRGRTGWQFQVGVPALFYATAGMALTRLSFANSFSDTSQFHGSESSSNSQALIGCTLGGGAEFAITEHLSVNAEYLYLNFPSLSASSSISGTSGGFGVDGSAFTSPFRTNVDFHSSLFRLGIVYRFDSI